MTAPVDPDFQFGVYLKDRLLGRFASAGEALAEVERLSGQPIVRGVLPYGFRVVREKPTE